MNPILNIATKEFDNNYLFLNDKYEERIFNWHKTGGPGRYANYYFKLIPIFKTNLLTTNEKVKYYEIINRVVLNLRNESLNVLGFNIYFATKTVKSLFGNSSIGYERQILFYTALDFFKIAAGYLCKIRLV